MEVQSQCNCLLAGKQFCVHESIRYQRSVVLDWDWWWNKSLREPARETRCGAMTKMSTVGGGSPRMFVVHINTETEYNVTNSGANSWTSVDLGEVRVRQLAPEYYCLRHEYTRASNMLWNWRLVGSNDDQTWTILKTHTNDGALGTQAWSTASWPIQAPTAKCSSSGNQLLCSGIELYGLLTE